MNTNPPISKWLLFCFFPMIFLGVLVEAGEFHVSVHGDDRSIGSESEPLRTIQGAAEKALPGDVITVHEGVYRERVNPPRGGASPQERIVYRAAPGEKVEIKGSEIIKGWEPQGQGVWKVTIPNEFFGDHNPYRIQMRGDWLDPEGHWNHTGEVYLNGRSLYEVKTRGEVFHPIPHERSLDREAARYAWFCETDSEKVTIWANFRQFDPNREMVEIHVRESCFYPDQPGRDYITVRGFEMSQAATPWAAPTAEQIGLIGTHWSKGWMIEECVIHDSKCSGITLGKDRETGHNAWSKARAKGGAVIYNEVILRALKAGWNKEEIGSHIVRNNTIYNCEQTGICGSMGAAFSEVTGNHIYNIWRKRLFTGAEIAGIKFHGPIDTLIQKNHIHDAYRGLWMDWMTQGTRISANLCYRNEFADLFSEVNHGPYIVDNNLFLTGIQNWSQGGAFLHNLIVGKIFLNPVQNRYTPYHHSHSTELMGVSNIRCGDDRFYRNLFVAMETGQLDFDWAVSGPGLESYDLLDEIHPIFARSNVYLNGARAPVGGEPGAIVFSDHDPRIELVREDNQLFLVMSLPQEVFAQQALFVTTESLGKTLITGLEFKNRDGSPLVIRKDYEGELRRANQLTAGPFADPGVGRVRIPIWQERAR